MQLKSTRPDPHHFSASELERFSEIPGVPLQRRVALRRTE